MLRAFVGEAGLQAPQCGDQADLVRCGRHAPGKPHVGAGGKIERCGHHPHDRSRHTLEHHARADHALVGVEATAPERIRQNHRTTDVVRGVRVIERAAELGTNAEHREECRGGARRGHSQRVADACDRQTVRRVGRQSLEDRVVLLQLDVLRIVHRGVRREDRARRLVRRDVELLGVGERQRPKEHAVQDGEHRRVRADAERERERRDDREARCAAERSKGEADVLDQSLEPHAAPHLARHFLHMADVAELAPRRGFGIARRFAACDAIAYRHGEVRADLVVEIRVATVAPLPGKFGKSHDSPSATGGRMTPAIAAESCSHFERSTASCLRPAAVSL